jgi:tetratricopeptide (TPR) repeat protein
MTLNRVYLVIVGATLWLLPASVHAQTAEDRVRQLYASADYEQALDALGTAADPIAHQYRALCLLALGRTEEAEASLTALVTASPDFTASDEDVPPRFVAMVEKKRQELLPALLRRQFAEARELFQAKAYSRAVTAFERLMTLSADPQIRRSEGVEDLRLLAAGFIDLAKAPVEPATTTAAGTPAIAPSRPAAPRISTPPVMRRQVLPPWPNDAGRPIFQPVGSVRLHISSTGRVTAAAMIKGLHPSYDQRLLAAAMNWEYAPATLNGDPVDSESVVEVRVQLPPR